MSTHPHQIPTAIETIAVGSRTGAPHHRRHSASRSGKAEATGTGSICSVAFLLPSRSRSAIRLREDHQVDAQVPSFSPICIQPDFSHDRQEYFKSPVNKNEVPDYYDIIVNPMCWDMIDRRLDSHEYLDLAEFKVWCEIYSR